MKNHVFVIYKNDRPDLRLLVNFGNHLTFGRHHDQRIYVPQFVQTEEGVHIYLPDPRVSLLHGTVYDIENQVRYQDSSTNRTGLIPYRTESMTELKQGKRPHVIFNSDDIEITPGDTFCFGGGFGDICGIRYDTESPWKVLFRQDENRKQ